MPPSDQQPDAQAVARAAAGLGRHLTPEQAGTISGYLALLARFRSKVNLVGPADWETVLATLVADSWHVADFLSGPAGAAVLPPADRPVLGLDFGAGAGLPGIPLRAFFDRGEYVLLEAREKRAFFLAEAAARLGLSGLSVAEGRVEDTVPGIVARHPDAFVLCVSRAFAPWPQFLALCRRIVRPPFAALTMTGEAPAEAEMPQGFVLAARASYRIGEKTRYLALFASSMASM
jgi:16S rRNA (guanine527-N7)-methyltransferase